mmetsp:Transcript_9394/g.16360  ORF Transcript_9394/g.16360 Transcript_9394/m.16360 type:complete len:83 (-) Transcript_9394:1443-1691(-)
MLLPTMQVLLPPEQSVPLLHLAINLPLMEASANSLADWKSPVSSVMEMEMSVQEVGFGNEVLAAQAPGKALHLASPDRDVTP